MITFLLLLPFSHCYFQSSQKIFLDRLAAAIMARNGNEAIVDWTKKELLALKMRLDWLIWFHTSGLILTKTKIFEWSYVHSNKKCNIHGVIHNLTMTIMHFKWQRKACKYNNLFTGALNVRLRYVILLPPVLRIFALRWVTWTTLTWWTCHMEKYETQLGHVRHWRIINFSARVSGCYF